MDATLMQQTVMNTNTEEFNGGLSTPMQTTIDSSPPSSIPIEGLTLNGIEVEEEQTAEALPTKLKPALTYDELFPALPGGGLGSSGGSTSAWGNSQTKNTQNHADMRVQSSNIMTVFHVPRDKLAMMNNANFGESTSHSICADITKTTGARIEMSMAKDNSLSFIVSGKVDAVPKAKKLVLEKFQAQNTKSVRVPKEHHKLILGKKGARLQSLEASTGTKISVPNASDLSELITIVGSREGIDRASADIVSRSSEQLKHAMESFSVPKIFHPFITGGNNSNVNALNTEYDVRINVPPNNVQSDDITIIGEKESICKVRDILLKTYQDMEKTVSSISVEVGKPQHKHVVGQKGCNIAEILTLHGVSVEVPPPDSTITTITLRGPPEKIGSALNAVYEKAHSQVTEEVVAPMWLHRYIIGKKGANINKITEEFPQVHIEMDDNAEKIKLEGPRAEVHKVRENLVSMIDEMLNRIKQETIPVDSKFHRHIIGRSGANVNRIRSEYNVFINFDDNCIKLEGAPEALDSVKAELTEIIHKLENEKEKDVTIDSRIHGVIIGPKGEKIREIRNQFNQVIINIPDPAQKSDVVKLRGPKEDVDACAKFLQKMAKTLLEDNFQIKVPIFKQFLKFVIGRGGSNINKIIAETGVRIDVNNSNGEGTQDEILLTGKKENCEKAQAKIKEIESEMANITEMEILIPAKLHVSFIGHGGKLVRSISEECGGVNIKFPAPSKKSDKVSIRGPKEDVQKAKKILIEMSNEKQLAGFTTEIKCKVQHHRFLIGKNGASIRKVNESTGARIIFPSDKDEDKETITIMGKKDQIAKAKKELEATIAKFENISEDTVQVPAAYHMHFVARRAEVIRQLGEEFGGVNISVPKAGTGNEMVSIKGAVECVAGAKKRILEIVHDLESCISVDVFIPQHHHRTVMGTRGSNVQDIIQRYNVKIKFPDRSDDYPRDDTITEETARPIDLVKVSGSAEKCAAVVEELKALVPVIISFEVPFEYHSKIIGSRGSQIRQLMNDHQVNIQLPPASHQSNTVSIIGRADKVEGAREAINAIVEGLESEEKDRVARSFQATVNVDPQFHSKLIGKKGATISKIRDKYGVNIRIPRQDDEDPTLITIIGYEDKCLEAREAICEISGDLASQIKLDVMVENRFHARLIGQRGRNIKKVMEKHKVLISFPGSNTEEADNVISITGSEANCLECQDYILNQVEEFRQEMEERNEHDAYINSYNAPKPTTLGTTLDGMMRQQESASDNVAGTVEETQQVEEPMQREDKPQMEQHVNKKGFVVPGAPWTQEAPDMLSSTDFPSIGAQPAPSLSVWGPKRG